MTRGLVVSIFKDAKGYDCSNGGVSSRHDEAILTGPGIPEIFEANEDRPVLVLCRGNLPGTVKVVPADAGNRWPMFGGTFVYTSDSRFHDAVAKITGFRNSGAIPLHDRFES